MTRGRLIALLAAAALAVAALAATTAGAAAPRVSFNDVEDEVMCVSCGVPLNIAESPQADRERAEIHRLIDQGLTKQQVKDGLVAQYGRNVLATPDGGGFGLAAYLVPIALVALIVAALAIVLPRWRRRPPAGPVKPVTNGTPSLSAAESRRLDEDLARYEL